MQPEQPDPKTSPERPPARWVLPALVLVILAGVVARLYGAWSYRWLTDPDGGIVALMAKHMAEGGPIPVFFYGQHYMGSLEPMISALCCRGLGSSGFAVCLGTALAAVAALPVLYLWAREAGGPRAGVVALALCALGPRIHFFFLHTPRGGYMVVMALGLLVLWLASRMAGRVWRGERVSWIAWLLLGFAAGLGWWSNQLITAALMASALVLLIGLRGRFWVPGVGLGLAGFLAGSTPFWLYNLRHDWVSLQMFENVGAVHEASVWALLGQRILTLVGLESWPMGLRVAVLVLYGIILLAALVVAGLRGRRGWNPALTAAGLFIGFSLLIYARSSFLEMNTARYLVPLVPAFGLLAGYLVSRLTGWARRGVLVVVLLILASHLPVLSEALARSRGAPGQRAQAAELAARLMDSKTDAVYASFRYHPLNFNLGERWPFTDVRGERYPPIARKAELAIHPAVLDRHGSVDNFLVQAGGRDRVTRVNKRRVNMDLEPPPRGLLPVLPSGIESLEDRDGRDLAPLLLDRDEDSVALLQPGGHDAQFLKITFREPVPLREVVLLGPASMRSPRECRVEFQIAGNSTWEEAKPWFRISPFVWSGARLYPNRDRLRIPLRLDDRPVRALRIFLADMDRSDNPMWPLCELWCFRAAPEPAPFDIAALAEILIQRQVDRVYAERDVVNALYRDTAWPGRLSLDGAVQDPARTLPVRLVPARGIAALVAPAYAASSRAVLREGAISFEEEEVPGGILFSLGEADGDRSGRPLTWHGSGLLHGHAQTHARALMQAAAVALESPGAEPSALELVASALAVYPNAITLYPEVFTRLESVLPAEWAVLRHDRMEPECSLPVAFGKDFELLGLSAEPRRARPGETVTLTYFWRCRPDTQPRAWNVFAHFLQDEQLHFQDDHALLETLTEARRERQPGDEVFREVHTLAIPAEAPAGAYTLRLGLVNRATLKRLRPRTDLPTADRAVNIAAPITVETAP